VSIVGLMFLLSLVVAGGWVMSVGLVRRHRLHHRHYHHPNNVLNNRAMCLFCGRTFLDQRGVVWHCQAAHRDEVKRVETDR